MLKTFRELGFKKLFKFLGSIIFDFIFALMILPPMRVFLLRLLGAHVGKDVVIHRIRFLNLYRGSFCNLLIGDYSFLGGEVLLDLADKIQLGQHVTLAEHTTILTHLNVGYRDHPLQRYFPAHTKPTIFSNGVFVGVNSTLLPGVRIGEGAFIGAGSLVHEDVPAWTLVAGVPAKSIRKLEESINEKEIIKKEGG